MELQHQQRPSDAVLVCNTGIVKLNGGWVSTNVNDGLVNGNDFSHIKVSGSGHDEIYIISQAIIEIDIDNDNSNHAMRYAHGTSENADNFDLEGVMATLHTNSAQVSEQITDNVSGLGRNENGDACKSDEMAGGVDEAEINHGSLVLFNNR